MRKLALALAIVFASAFAYADDKLAQARTLDQQGVVAYSEGRYKDALVFFEQAHKLGGPSSELWNMARCWLKLDEPEKAYDALERYLAQRDIAAEERAQAEKELAELEKRPSLLTVTSSPSDGDVAIDGVSTGNTPLTARITPGEHEITISKDGYTPKRQHAAAHFGRAIVISVSLDRAPPTDDRTVEGGPLPTSAGRTRPHVEVEAGGGIHVPYWGSLGSVYPTVFVNGGYAFIDNGRFVLGAGLRVAVAIDGWSTSPGTVNIPAGSCTLPNDFSAAETRVYAAAFGAVRIHPRVRLGGAVGLGIAAYTGGNLGGDVFVPACDVTPGARLAFVIDPEASVVVVPHFRVVVHPIGLEIHPSYGGARPPTSGVWLRVSTVLGLAIDF